jgi:hypothetical protein
MYNKILHALVVFFGSFQNSQTLPAHHLRLKHELRNLSFSRLLTSFEYKDEFLNTEKYNIEY